MKKAIISQPMRDKTEEQIRQERVDAIAYLEANGYEVVEPFISISSNEGSVPLKRLAERLKTIAESNLVYFLAGWEEARGCRIEYQCCKEYGVDIQFDKKSYACTPSLSCMCSRG